MLSERMKIVNENTMAEKIYFLNANNMTDKDAKSANKGSVSEDVAEKKKAGEKAVKITTSEGKGNSRFLAVRQAKKHVSNDASMLKKLMPWKPNCANGELSIVNTGFPQ